MILETNIGAITLGYVQGSLVCEFGVAQIDEEPDHLVAGQLTQYFSGKKVQHFSVPVPNSTPFTQRCWEACRKIPTAKRSLIRNSHRGQGHQMPQEPQAKRCVTIPKSSSLLAIVLFPQQASYMDLRVQLLQIASNSNERNSFWTSKTV